MSNDSDQPAPSGFKSWWVWSALALMFVLALPAIVVARSGDVHDFVIVLACPLAAIVCGAIAYKKGRTGNTVAFVVTIVAFFELYAFLFFGSSVPPHNYDYVKKKKSEDNLKQLFCFMNIYAQTHNCFPSMQPLGSPNSGGARELHPLYLIAVDKPAFLNLLRPPGVALLPFSASPGPGEFDSDHIGYIYNSLVVPDQSNNPPLMAERCVEDGMFTPEEKPVFKDCAHILLANGIVKEVPVVGGKLQLGDIKVEDLEKLK